MMVKYRYADEAEKFRVNSSRVISASESAQETETTTRGGKPSESAATSADKRAATVRKSDFESAFQGAAPMSYLRIYERSNDITPSPGREALAPLYRTGAGMKRAQQGQGK